MKLLPSHKFTLFFGFLVFILLNACTSTKSIEQSTKLYSRAAIAKPIGIADLKGKKVNVTLVEATIKKLSVNSLDFVFPRRPLVLKPEYPVARQLVENYNNSINKTPGGHCLAVSKSRFEKAFEDVYGYSFYDDLSEQIATDELTPNLVFDYLYNSATSRAPKWRTLPRKYRGKGNAGALTMANFGDLVDKKGIWRGKLRPGALVQVWRLAEDFKKVRRGAKVSNFDPYGHSFVFLNYEINEKGEIEGIKIADQGYQSYRSLVPRDYEVWWGVNLKI